MIIIRCNRRKYYYQLFVRSLSWWFSWQTAF